MRGGGFYFKFWSSNLAVLTAARVCYSFSWDLQSPSVESVESSLLGWGQSLTSLNAKITSGKTEAQKKEDHTTARQTLHLSSKASAVSAWWLSPYHPFSQILILEPIPASISWSPAIKWGGVVIHLKKVDKRGGRSLATTILLINLDILWSSVVWGEYGIFLLRAEMLYCCTGNI